MVVTYLSRAAREAAASGYGDSKYHTYLDTHAAELHAYYTARGDTEAAERMFTRSLSESLIGNDGD